jgi:hypothetical protein
MAGEVTGKVVVYESSDGGTGDPRRTFWQFHIYSKGDTPTPPSKTAVTTNNPFFAETIRLALQIDKEVQVSYNVNDNNNVTTQVRIEIQLV